MQQAWASDAAGRLHESWSGQSLCVGDTNGTCPAAPPPPPPPPPPASGPQIHNAGVICLHHAGWHDIAAALYWQGTYHVWQGCPGAGGWHHALSTDLVRWANAGVDVLAGPAEKGTPCSGFATVDDSGTPCVGFRTCPGAGDGLPGLELRCAAADNLTAWGGPEYILHLPRFSGIPLDPPRPWVDTDGRWYAAISADACSGDDSSDLVVADSAAAPCLGGGAAYLYSSPALRGAGANWTAAAGTGRLFQSNYTVLTPTTGARMEGVFVTAGYVGALPGDPAGGATRVFTNNVCGAECCSCSTGWYLGTQAGGPGSPLQVDYAAPNSTGMVDWGSFVSNGAGVGLAGLASVGYGHGQYYSMARTLSALPNQVAAPGRKAIVGWIGGQTPATQSLPRDLSLAADGSGLLQAFAPELQALRKPAGVGGGQGVRSQQAEVFASFVVAAGAAPPPFGVQLLRDDSGSDFAATGVNLSQQHVFLLGAAGPLYPPPPGDNEGSVVAVAGETVVHMHAIIDHTILTVIWNNKTAFTLFHTPCAAGCDSYALFGVDGMVVRGSLQVWDLYSANNTGV